MTRSVFFCLVLGVGIVISYLLLRSPIEHEESHSLKQNIELQGMKPRENVSRSTVPPKVDVLEPTIANSRRLSVGSYLQALLVDDWGGETRTLKVVSELRQRNTSQYEIESTEGEVGIITLGVDRVFAFLASRNGIYEYSGSSLKLRLERKPMLDIEDDIFRSELKVVEK